MLGIGVGISSAGTSPLVSYTWTIQGAGLSTSRTEKACKMSHPPSLRQGSYTVTLTVTAQDGQTSKISKNVVVKDLLIVSIGDSIASGEGVPDQRQRLDSFGFVKPGPVWEDKRCHRSAYAGPAQAALQIERSDPHTSVTFLSFACSGASITEGLIGQYIGQEPPQGTHDKLDPQTWQVAKTVCGGITDSDKPTPTCIKSNNGRQIDALMITVVGNDIKFSDIIIQCIIFGGPSSPVPCGNNPIVTSDLNTRLSTLPNSFESLAADIQQRFKVSNIFITEYQDPTHGKDGSYCRILGTISPEAAKWAHDNVLTKLNQIIHDAATKNGWIFVGDIASRFLTHGYCAGDQRWISTLSDSITIQGNKDGTMHPNVPGHAVYKDRLAEEISIALSRHISRNLAAINWIGNDFQVFSKTSDNEMFHLWSGSGSDGLWHSLGQVPFAGDPVAVTLPGPNVEVFARGTDNFLYHIFTTSPGHWNPDGWLALGQKLAFAGDPVAVSFPNGGIEIFSKATNNQLFHMFTTSPGHWNSDGWLALGQKLAFAGANT